MKPPLKRGEANGNARLTASKVRRIHALWATQRYQRVDLARRFGVSLQTIAGILSGRVWRHLFPGKRGNSLHKGEGHVGHKLTEADVLSIREKLAAGQKGVCLAAEYGVSPSVVSEIGSRKAWRHV